jgi:hypothetical protein
VYVDGIERGLTPLSIDSISPGVHTLRLTKDRYNDWSAQIAVSARKRLDAYIELAPLMGKIAVNIHGDTGQEQDFRPSVFLDGVEQEEREFNAEAGWRAVKVSLFGWEDAQKTIFIGANESIALDFELKRASFTLKDLQISHSTFNPYAMGARGVIAVDFTVSAAGDGCFKVFDGANNEVFSSTFDRFRQPDQRYVWDGKDNGGNTLNDGGYTLKIEAEDSENEESFSLAAAVQIDSSLDDTPAALSSAQAGMFFVPAASTQSKGSFQIETGIIVGKPLGEGASFDTLLFSAAFCFTPLDSWQFAGAVNIRPDNDGAASPAAAGTVKRQMRKPDGLAPGVAAAVSYGWVMDGFESASGIKSGLQAQIPLSWRAGRRVWLHLTPAVLWTGKNGALSEALPRLVFSEGILCHFGLISAGLSAQSVVGLTSGLEGFSPAALSAELHFTPPRSNLSIGLQAGAFFNNNDTGCSGGLFVGAFF